MTGSQESSASGSRPGLLDRLRRRLWHHVTSSVGSDEPVITGQEKLERKLAYRFDDIHILRQALTHRSHVHVTGMDRLQSNERLEFLGDAVLGLVVNEFLYEEFEGKEEGDLTKIKSLLVCGATLARVGDRLRLGEHLFLSRSEAGTGGRKRESILADATEAVIGAIYLDGGLEKAREFISRNILINVEAALEEGSHRNYKSLLQETLQARYKVPPRYRVTYTTGPDHARRFTVKVSLKGAVLGVGSGTSKKQAEQRAAESALSRLSELEDEGTLPEP
jgi:ribonuclease-3